jgi:hypothetical protein
MLWMNMKKRIQCCVAAVLTVIPSVAVWAEDGFDIPKRDQAFPLLGLLLTVAAIAAVMGIAFKNSRRSHLS